MLNFLKSIGSPNDPPPAVGEEKKHTRFSKPEDLAQLRDSKKFTRSPNRHVREQSQYDRPDCAAQMAQSQSSRPEPRSKQQAAQPVTVEVMPVSSVKPQVPADVPISPDILRKALPQRFAAMKIKQHHQNTFAT